MLQSKSLYNYIEHLRHIIIQDDISPETHKEWKIKRKTFYHYLQNGVKSSLSNILLSFGVVGLFEELTHNPFLAQYGFTTFDIFTLSIFFGFFIIWFIDLVSEYHQKKLDDEERKEKEKSKKEIQETREENLELKKRIDELAEQIANEKVDQLVEEKVDEKEDDIDGRVEIKLREILHDLRYDNSNPANDCNNNHKQELNEIKATNKQFIKDITEE